MVVVGNKVYRVVTVCLELVLRNEFIARRNATFSEEFPNMISFDEKGKGKHTVPTVETPQYGFKLHRARTESGFDFGRKDSCRATSGFDSEPDLARQVSELLSEDVASSMV